jgi:hypothetical protein
MVGGGELIITISVQQRRAQIIKIRKIKET